MSTIINVSITNNIKLDDNIKITEIINKKKKKEKQLTVNDLQKLELVKTNNDKRQENYIPENLSDINGLDYIEG